MKSDVMIVFLKLKNFIFILNVVVNFILIEIPIVVECKTRSENLKEFLEKTIEYTDTETNPCENFTRHACGNMKNKDKLYLYRAFYDNSNSNPLFYDDLYNLSATSTTRKVVSDQDQNVGKLTEAELKIMKFIQSCDYVNYREQLKSEKIRKIFKGWPLFKIDWNSVHRINWIKIIEILEKSQIYNLVFKNLLCDSHKQYRLELNKYQILDIYRKLRIDLNENESINENNINDIVILSKSVRNISECLCCLKGSKFIRDWFKLREPIIQLPNDGEYDNSGRKLFNLFKYQNIVRKTECKGNNTNNINFNQLMTNMYHTNIKTIVNYIMIMLINKLETDKCGYGLLPNTIIAQIILHQQNPEFNLHDQDIQRVLEVYNQIKTFYINHSPMSINDNNNNSSSNFSVRYTNFINKKVGKYLNVIDKFHLIENTDFTILLDRVKIHNNNLIKNHLNLQKFLRNEHKLFSEEAYISQNVLAFYKYRNLPISVLFNNFGFNLILQFLLYEDNDENTEYEIHKNKTLNCLKNKIAYTNEYTIKNEFNLLFDYTTALKFSYLAFEEWLKLNENIANEENHILFGYKLNNRKLFLLNFRQLFCEIDMKFDMVENLFNNLVDKVYDCRQKYHGDNENNIKEMSKLSLIIDDCDF